MKKKIESFLAYVCVSCITAAAIIGFCAYMIPAVLDIMGVPLPHWVGVVQHHSGLPLLLCIFIFATILLFYGIYSMWTDDKSESQKTAELVVELMKKQDDLDSEIKKLKLSSFHCPWYTESATVEQREAFEKELTRLCSVCKDSRKGVVINVVNYLYEKDKERIIRLPDSNVDIYNELKSYYGYDLSDSALYEKLKPKSQKK